MKYKKELAGTYDANGIELLEKKINTLGTIKQEKTIKPQVAEEQKIQTKTLEDKPKQTVAKATTKPAEGLNWEEIVSDLRKSGKMMLYTNLINTTANKINDMTIGIEFPTVYFNNL